MWIVEKHVRASHSSLWFYFWLGERVAQSNAKPINYILLTVTLLEIVTQIYTFTNDIVIINTNSNILYASIL